MYAKYPIQGNERTLRKTCFRNIFEILRYPKAKKSVEYHSIWWNNNITKNVYFECFFFLLLSTKMPKYMQRTLDTVTERHYQKIVIWVVLGYIKHHIAEKRNLFFFSFLHTKKLKRVKNNFLWRNNICIECFSAFLDRKTPKYMHITRY